jgi:F-box and leucine-rich repeat protein GRR1
MNCNINDKALKSVFNHCRDLRELRTSQVDIAETEITDGAFLGSPLSNARYFEQLRLVDLTGITTITDMSLRVLVNAAPKIRSLVLNKCSGITDEGVISICQLGKFLHFLHLGHCSQITDASIKRLAIVCNRIRYLDLACCTGITDQSVIELSRNLPKLKRIGLVKCARITDISLSALTSHVRIASSLERIHLSYCTRLSVRAIGRLLNVCYKLNHLSLTHVPSFLRKDLQEFCRSPPKELTEVQRHAFCVYSGKGVQDLRNYLNTIHSLEDNCSIHSSTLFTVPDHPSQSNTRHLDNITASTTPDIMQEE